MVRPQKYDWDDKRDICHQLFVVEKKTPTEIVKYFANHFGVPESELPSARLFRRQFTDRWQFPPRKPRMTPEDKETLVERIRQLWEQNLSVANIKEAIEDEGWELGDSELHRLRKAHGLIRRGVLGAYDTEGATKKKGKKRKTTDVAAEELEAQDDQHWAMAGASQSTGAQMSTYKHAITPEEAARRAQHLVDVQAQSDAALAARKRRRRIRGYGHLGPDEPGLPPRYGSETTLDECKAFLQLNNDMYQAMRDEYEAICNDMGIERKKTVVESGLWQASKDRLVRENVHLSGILHPLQGDLERKVNAVDVICADVTKRMRDRTKKLTVGEANNVLGLNPSASKELRRAFYVILEQDQYTTRLACGDEHWAELRQAWFAGSPLLQRVVAQGDPHEMKCMEVLCRDACKRFNDDCLKKDPSRKQFQHKLYGPGPGAARANQNKKPARLPAAVPTATASPEKKGKGKKVTKIHAKSTTAGASGTQDAPISLDPALTNPYAAPPAEPLAIPAYFRLSPQSQIIGHHSKLWLGKLTARSVGALHAAATSKAGAARVQRVQGIITNDDGTEDAYQIDGDDELDVYLGAVGEEGKSTFLVVLEGGYA